MGESQLQKAQPSFREHSPQCPVATDIAQIRMSIGNWFRLGSHSLFFLSLLQSIDATATQVAGWVHSSWLVLVEAIMSFTLGTRTRNY